MTESIHHQAVQISLLSKEVRLTRDIEIAKQLLLMARGYANELLPLIEYTGEAYPEGAEVGWLALGRYCATTEYLTGVPNSWAGAAYKRAVKISSWNDDEVKPIAVFEGINHQLQRKESNYTQQVPEYEVAYDRVREKITSPDELINASLLYLTTTLSVMHDFDRSRAGWQHLQQAVHLYNTSRDGSAPPLESRSLVLNQVILPWWNQYRRYRQYRQSIPKNAPPSHEFSLPPFVHIPDSWVRTYR